MHLAMEDIACSTERDASNRIAARRLQHTARSQVVPVPTRVQNSSKVAQFPDVLESLSDGGSATSASQSFERERPGAKSRARTSTNSFPLTPLASTAPNASPLPADSLVSTGSKLANLACFSVTSSNLAPLPSAVGERNATSSFSTASEKSLSSESARTRAASGESSASEVSFRRERRAGVIGSVEDRCVGGKEDGAEEAEGGV